MQRGKGSSGGSHSAMKKQRLPGPTPQPRKMEEMQAGGTCLRWAREAEGEMEGWSPHGADPMHCCTPHSLTSDFQQGAVVSLHMTGRGACWSPQLRSRGDILSRTRPPAGMEGPPLLELGVQGRPPGPAESSCSPVRAAVLLFASYSQFHEIYLEKNLLINYCLPGAVPSPRGSEESLLLFHPKILRACLFCFCFGIGD